MSESALLERLAHHRTLAGTPEEELRWLVAHGSLARTTAGTVYVRKGEPPDKLWILLSGHIAIHIDRGLGPRLVMEWKTGDVSGGMPYSRVRQAPGDIVSLEDSELFVVQREHFPELIRECPTITTRLVHVLLDRARAFTSSDLHDEKMLSLGRLSAGLAHELNNPASAVRRSSQRLVALMRQAEVSTRVLAASGLTSQQLDTIDQAIGGCGGAQHDMGPLERADQEEALDAWLSTRGLDPDLAGVLIESGVTNEALAPVGAAVHGDALDAAVRWIAACCAVKTLAGEIDTASTRIHDLVSAIRRFSYMDQAQASEAIDITQGLRDSVSLMQHKARQKSVSLRLHVPDGLPRAQAIGSDLNQVWTNLIDNALDAVPQSGQVTVEATSAHGGILVSVVDNGPGIPPEIRSRIFDAFFTTKGVGQGTGLGLEIARRLVLRNGGDIQVDSVPGRTEFKVLLHTGSSTGATG